MTIKKLHLYILQLICISGILSLTNCARVTSPGGGEKDEKPPVLIKSIPEDGQTNFTSQIIFLEFDELVQTNQIESNLIITPKPSGSFRTRNSRNTIQLEFFEPFDDSTTYTFSFASTIEDLTDRNAAVGLSLSFSTGDYLDSLSITGQIKNLYDQIIEEDILVSLYTADDSLNILNGPASYYTKTDTAGNYIFKNLPPNDYRVYAVKDKNENNKADSDEEKYGFYSDTLRVIENVDNINFTIQNLSTKDLRLISGRHFGRYYELTFNKSITEFKAINNDEAIYHQTAKDIIRFFRTDQLFNDTTELIFEARDSLGSILLDTAKYYFVESEIEPDRLNHEFTPKRNIFRPSEEVTLSFNKPVNLVNPDSIQVFVDSLNVYPFSVNEITPNKNRTEFKFPFVISDYIERPGQQARIEFKKGTFISIDADTTPAIQKTVEIAIEEETGLITGRVNTNSPNVIVQLLNSRTLQVIEETNDINFRFPYLDAGTYMIRAINDLNGNGKWDTGNIIRNEDPEPVAFYYDSDFDTQLIELRKNWERSQIIINLR